MTRLDTLLRPPKRYNKLLWLFTLAALVVACWLAAEAYRLNEKATQHADRLRAVDAALARARTAQATPVMSKAAELEWQSIRQELDFAWPKLLVALEKTSSKNIELLEFHPDKHTGWVTLKGEARNHTALQDYLNTLTTRPEFRDVHVTHWQTVEREQLETVEFEIKLRFVPLPA